MMSPLLVKSKIIVSSWVAPKEFANLFDNLPKLVKKTFIFLLKKAVSIIKYSQSAK